MAFYLNLFTPETYQAFSHSDRTITGFPIRQEGAAKRLKAGDMLICYITRLSRWCGLLEIIDNSFLDSKPIFVENDDPYIVRFRVQAKVWLPLTETLPIHRYKIWQHLSFTQSLNKNEQGWTGILRQGLNKLNHKDGLFLADALLKQAKQSVSYPLNEKEQKKLKTHTVNRMDKVVEVSIPDNVDETLTANEQLQTQEVRESIKMQALLAQISACMGLSVWLSGNSIS